MTFSNIYSGFPAGLSWADAQPSRRWGTRLLLGGLSLILAGPLAAATTWADTSPDQPAAPAAVAEGEVVAGETPTVAEEEAAGTVDPNASLSDEAARPRSIERITNVRYPDRDGTEPDWLETVPHWDEGVYLAAVESRLQRTQSESERALDQRLVEMADSYVNELLGTTKAADLIDYEAAELRERGLVVDRFSETVHVTTGDMRQTHALVAFDNAFADEVQSRWQEVKARSRLLLTGIGSGALILLLTTLFSYFRLDTATRGYYTGRLQFASAGTILAIIVAGVVVAQWIPWL